MSMKQFLSTLLIGSSVLLSSTVVAQDWSLDSHTSSLHFVSVKNDVVAETHEFKKLSGNWDGSDVRVSVPMSSLDTQIPIRNERMLKHLFAADEYPTATVVAKLEQSSVLGMDVAQSKPLTVPLKVSIAGVSAQVNAHVMVTRLSADRFLATTTQPLMLSTKDFQLTAGIEKLRTIAGLNRIDFSVPVTFTVQFAK